MEKESQMTRERKILEIVQDFFSRGRFSGNLKKYKGGRLRFSDMVGGG